MKKAAIVITLTLALVAGLFVTLPVMASPTNGQKVPVKVTFVVDSSKTVENFATNGNVTHRLLSQVWSVELTIGDSLTPIKGTAEVTRDTVRRYSKPGGVDQVTIDRYVISFPSEEGGFEGHSIAMLTDYTAGPPATYNIDVHVLLQGTEAFEGQTLNAWQSGASGTGIAPLWEGYLLKP